MVAATAYPTSQLRQRGHICPKPEGGVGEVEGAAQAGGREVGVQRRRGTAVGEAQLLRRILHNFAVKDGTRERIRAEIIPINMEIRIDGPDYRLDSSPNRISDISVVKCCDLE